MDPDVLDLETGVKALAVLSLIPVVAFAIWAEHFGRHIDQLLIKRPQFEREPEVEKVRLASLCIILFQLTLFLGSTEIRHAYPMETEISFAVTILLQLWVQSRTEKKIQPVTIQPDPKKEDLKKDDLGSLALRAVVSWTIGGALYLLILVCAIQLTSWITSTLQISPNTQTLLVLMGGSLGVIAGLGLNFALSPFHLKKMLPTAPLQDSKLLSDLESCFKKAGLKPPLFHVIHLYTVQIGGSFLAGFQKGRGPLRQSLFISSLALKILSTQEVKAIVFNQISHIILHHFRKRFLFSFALIAMTTLLSVLSVVVSENFLNIQSALELVGPAVALISFFASFRFLSEQNRKHEFEADLYSIDNLGVSLEDFTNALRKLDPPPPENSVISSQAHLDAERRIQNISKYLSKRNKTDPTHPQVDPQANNKSGDKKDGGSNHLKAG